MVPPFVSFVTWNRMGLSVRNITALLRTTDDFELHIVDNNSMDDTWDYIMQLKDSRIKSRIRLDTNRGHVYSTNYNLSKRRKGQYFITVDNDVNIHSPDWITRFLSTFQEFSEVGLLGVVSPEYFARYRLPLTRHERNGECYLEMHRGFVEGCCQCLRPELLDILGYFSEETCMGDEEICFRICNFTSFKAGFIPTVEIDQTQRIACSECEGRHLCTLGTDAEECFEIRNRLYRNVAFRKKYGWKYDRYVQDIVKGKRTVFCASVHDEKSRREHYYDERSAKENFQYYMESDKEFTSE